MLLLRLSVFSLSCKPFLVSLCVLPAPHQVQRNCCLTLCNFSIPEELEFQYSRVNQLLLKILEPARQDESIQRIAVHLCNALVCQVDNHHKEAVGKMGFVKVTVRWALLFLTLSYSWQMSIKNWTVTTFMKNKYYSLYCCEIWFSVERDIICAIDFEKTC